MSVATTDEQRAVQESIRAWAANTQPQAALREKDADSAQQCWKDFAPWGFSLSACRRSTEAQAARWPMWLSSPRLRQGDGAGTGHADHACGPVVGPLPD